MAIRYDKKLNQEINRTIKNFNQKIRRLEKQEREVLPSTISKKELKESVYTRSELKRRLQELQRFSKRGAEEVLTTKSGLKITKYELENLKRESKIIKARLTREINKMKKTKPKVFGKEQVATFSEMGDTRFLNLLARRKALNKNIEELSQKDYENYLKLVEKTKKKKDYYNIFFKDNYLKALNYLAYFYGYDKSKLQDIEDKLKSLSSSNFLKAFDEDKSIKAILEYYPFVTGKIQFMNPDDIREDVEELYNNLYENIDVILQDYA